jgi:hypothetical protein
VVPVVRLGARTEVTTTRLLKEVLIIEQKFEDKSMSGWAVSGNNNTVPGTALNVVVGGVKLPV